MSHSPARTPVPVREVQPGKFFESIARPPMARPALPYRVEFGHVHILDTRSGHHGVQAHQHPNYEVLLVRRGDYHCRVNGTAVSASAGGVVIIAPGDWHQDQCFTPVAFFALAFRVLPGPTSGQSANLLRADLSPADHVVPTSDGALHALVERMCDEGRGGDAFSIPLLDSLAQEFAWRLLRLLPQSSLDERMIGGLELHGFGSELLAFCDRQVAGSPSAADMAAALGIAERTLTQRCRTAFGTSPARFFTRYRLERARLLLVQTDLSIKAIAEHLGFENPYHFSTVYKRVHGVPPSTHRPVP